MADAGTAERPADGIADRPALAPAGDDRTFRDHFISSPLSPASGIRGRAFLSFGRRPGDLLRDQPFIGADRILDGFGHIAVTLEEVLGVLAPLADPLAGIGEP